MHSYLEIKRTRKYFYSFKTLLFIFIFIFSILLTFPVYSGFPEGHAPIGVMGDHTHKTGEVMLSYRYMFMSMDGNRDGTSDVSTSEVLEDFMVAPTDMDMHMHMFGLMYAPSDTITIMTMVPYIKKSMNHITRMGVKFETESEGFGDIRTTGLIKVYNDHNNHIHLNAGISFPTGSIDEKDDTPAANNVVLPYPMQLGSGTFDLLPGVTYLGHKDIFSWGSQITGTIRLGENDNDYTLGNKLEITSWGAAKLNEWFSASARLDWKGWQNIDGADPKLNPNMVPTADPDRRGGNRLDGLIGLNFINHSHNSYLNGHRLALEIGVPLYQDLDGPQLETDWLVTFGWQYAFKLY